MQRNPMTLTRQELYDLVWSKPVTQVATQLGMSDVGLAKRCRAVSVPVPPRGYWARKAAGQEPKRPKLPKYRASAVEEEEAQKAPPPPVDLSARGPEQVLVFTPKVNDGTPDFRKPEDDVWLAERHAFDAEPDQALVFEDPPSRWHQGLAGQRDALKEAAKKLEASRKDHLRYEALPPNRQGHVDWNRNGSDWRAALRDGQRLLDYHKPRAFRVSSACLNRALAIANAVAIAAQARGFTFEDDQAIGRLKVKGHGGAVAMRLTERLEDFIEKVRRYDGKYEAEKRRRPTGVLKLSLDKSYGSSIDFTDAPGRPVEKQLAKVMDAIYVLIVRSRIETRKSQYREQTCKLEEQARARAAQLRRLEEQKRALEARRRRALIRQARRWEQAAVVRAFIDHIGEAMRQAAPGTRERLNGWTAWALQVASELDPTADFQERVTAGADLGDGLNE